MPDSQVQISSQPLADLEGTSLSVHSTSHNFVINKQAHYFFLFQKTRDLSANIIPFMRHELKSLGSVGILKNCLF